MHLSSLFSGYADTPMLWRGTLESLTQLELPEVPIPKLPAALPPPLRLGHIAEYFTFALWSQQPDLELLAHNLQIPGAEQTLGELDALVRYKKQLIHVEMAYKFYLYDPQHGETALQHWIGPNRKDSLMEKLARLRNHQLPLIHTTEAQTALASYVSTEKPIRSNVWIKGQLFLPHGAQIDCSPLNNDCIAGTYIHSVELEAFSNNKFYLPTKLEWLRTPQAQVEWKSLPEIEEQIAPMLEEHYAPMLWMKSPKGTISKLFVVWWPNSQ